jgi:hypothetical protein
MLDRQLERRNMIWGIALFALFLVLAAGTFVIALVYLALD